MTDEAEWIKCIDGEKTFSAKELELDNVYMRTRSRRSLLAFSTTVLATIAGCQTANPSDGDSQPESESTTTEGDHSGTVPTSTESDQREYDPSDFSASAQLVHQPSVETPPTLELSLTNTSDEALAVKSTKNNGDPLEGIRAWPDGEPYFVMIPPNSSNVKLSEYPEQRRNGCWRLPEDAEPLVASMRGRPTLDPGESWMVTHHAYYYGSAENCFSPGEYALEEALAVGESREDVADETEPAVAVTYSVTVREDGTFAASAGNPHSVDG